MWILHWPLMLLGLLGAATAWVKPHWIATNEASINGARFISAVVAYAIALHMVGTPFPRYGIPFRPLLYILAVSVLVAGVRAGVGRLKRRREGVNSAAHL